MLETAETANRARARDATRRLWGGATGYVRPVAPLIPEGEFLNSPDREAAGDRFLAVDERLEPLIARINRFRVQPSSAFAGDDLASLTDAVSHQARALLTVAADNASTLSTVLVKANVLPTFAGFTLLRNAIECAGVALWLMGPNSRDDRVLRALQLSRESLSDLRRFEATVADNKYTGLSPGDPTLLRLVAERDKRPGNVGKSLKTPTVSERLDAAEAFVKRRAADQNTILINWQRASGLTHGRRHALWRNTDARLRGADHIGFQTVVTGDLIAVAAHYEATMNYIEDGLELLESRGGFQ